MEGSVGLCKLVNISMSQGWLYKLIFYMFFKENMALVCIFQKNVSCIRTNFLFKYT